MKLPSNIPVRNESGSALLAVLVIGFVIASLSMVTILSTKNSTSRVSARREVVSAFNIAEAGKEHALMRIRNDSISLVSGSDINILDNCPFDGGSYTVEYDANAAVDTLWIRSVGTLEEQSARIDVICVMTPVYTQMSPTIDAAVTTRSEIAVTGGCIIDGRDWDADLGTFTVPGVFGIKTCDILTQDGSSTVGGAGHAPANPATIGSYDFLVSPAGYPTTPEEVLGLPPGSLESYKTKTLPSFPFYDQIIYFDPSDLNKHELNCPNMQGSTGIFICHTDALDGSLKNINTTFKGIIITDRVNHVNAGTVIYGAVYTLSPVSGTNAFGNGNASIYYSSKVVNSVINNITVVTDTAYSVISWEQVI